MSLSRRSFLQVATATIAAPVTARAAVPDAAWTAAAHRRLAARPRILDASTRATLSAVADAVIPRSDTPGALDVSAPDFIELLIAEWLPADEVESLRRGLTGLDEHAYATHGMEWPALTAAAAAQEIAWAEAATPEPSDAQRALRRLKSWTIHAWITSEVVQKTVLRTNITPGKYEGCVPRPAAEGTR